MKRRIILIVFVVSGFIYSAFAQPFIIVADTAKGCDSLFVKFTISPSPLFNPVAWDFGNSKSSTKANPDLVKYDSAGVYTVKLRVTVGVKSYDTSLIIDIHKSPNPYFTFSTSPANAYTRDFSPPPLNNNYSYHFNWSFGDGTGDTVPDPVHLYDATGLYLVRYTVVDNIGCMVSYTKNVDVSELFKVPNVFTPNGDGINDLFTVFSAFGSTINLKIYNRNGLLVYEQSAEKVSWDGTVYGNKLSNGIYYYYIDATKATDSGPFRQKQNGFFYLFR